MKRAHKESNLTEQILSDPRQTDMHRKTFYTALFTTQLITGKTKNNRPSAGFIINTSLQKYCVHFLLCAMKLYIILQMLYFTLLAGIIPMESLGKIYRIIYLVERIIEVSVKLNCCHQSLTLVVGPQFLLC